MLGLGFPQLILILAGVCFTVAGVYGLAPSLVTSMFGGRGGASTPAKPQAGSQQTRKQQKAERARQQAEQAKAEAAAARAERDRLEAVRKAEQAKVDAEKQRLEAEMQQAEAEVRAAREAAEAATRQAEMEARAARLAAEAAKKQAEEEARAAHEAIEAPKNAAEAAAEKPAPSKPVLEPAATFTPAAGSLRLVDIVTAYQQPLTSLEMPAETAAMDQELVDELFAEMFALRSTVADLVGEVHQLRSEQKPRRFVIEEVSS